MRNTIETRLTGVRFRQRLGRALHGAIWGLAIGALAALALEGARRGFDAWPSAVPTFIVLIGAPIIGALFMAMRALPWSRAAAAVDAHYALKDRTATALVFSQRGEATPWHQLAIADAMEHLDNVDAKQVMPLRPPRRWVQAAALFAVAWVAVLWPGDAQRVQANAPAEPIPGIVAEAEQIEEDFKALEKLARDFEEPQMQKLAQELREAAEQMKQPGVDVKDALAKLSQMQAALQQQQAEFNLEAVEAQLSELGDALTLDEATAEVGRALKRGDYDSAADALEGMDTLAQSSSATSALSDLGESMRRRGLDRLARDVERMAEAMKRGDKESFCKACNGLGSSVRRHGYRRQMAAWMRQQMARLSECKSACAACNKNGGNGANQSQNPSQNWGTGSTGNPEGDPTQLDSHRQREQLTGRLGAGPMETETMHSPEARQVAGRDYREAYSEYRKLSEAVLESEPIPLGHRQTIRRYFEAIRPSGEESN